jgi:hypothetical protein
MKLRKILIIASLAPPAAAAGTVSNTPVTNSNVMSGAVRDHRRKRD